jgi:hypothetical protein
MSDAARGIKLAEGDGLMKNGDKYCKKDLFNWSPEYDRGAAEYEKAATIYKNHKEWAKAIYACAPAPNLIAGFGC